MDRNLFPNKKLHKKYDAYIVRTILFICNSYMRYIRELLVRKIYKRILTTKRIWYPFFPCDNFILYFLVRDKTHSC